MIEGLTAAQEDRMYLDLKGAHERLCRAQVHVGAPHRVAALQRAIDEIETVGVLLPQWSTYAMPSLPPWPGEEQGDG